MRIPLRLTLPAALSSLVLSLYAQNPLQAPPAPGGQGPATVPPPVGAAPEAPAQPDFPKPEEVLKGFERVVSTADGRKSVYTLWSRGKDQQLYAELPAQYANQRHYLALTVASGDNYAGLQAGDMYFYWRSYGKRIAMVTPELDVRSTGDKS